MKKTTLLLAALVVALGPLLGHAATPGADPYEGAPFAMERIAEPRIPAYTVSLADFGGQGDGHTMNTEAFRSAMAHLAARGGGRLTVPFGVWLTGPIELKSHVELHLDDGALVLFSDRREDYPLVDSYYEGVRSRRCMSPLTAMDAEHIAITGRGVFNGNGQAWRPVKKGKLTAGQWDALVKGGGALNEKKNTWYPSAAIRDISNDGSYMAAAYANGDDASWQKVHDYLRPTLVSLIRCKHILLEGVTFENSPSWNVHPLMCQDIIIRDVDIRNPWYAQNGDGLDLESCRNVLLTGTSLDVGDDAICIKSGRDKEGRDRGMPTENVIVRDCRVYHGHGGFVVGSEMSGGARNIWVSHCQFIGTDCGLRFKSTRGRGGVVERIYIDHVGMANMPGEAMTFDLYYAGANGGNNKAEAFPVDETTPCFRDIHISHVSVRGASKAAYVNGLPEMPVRNLTVTDSHFATTEGFILNHADGITLSSVGIHPAKGEQIVERDGVKNLTVK